jgi:hypothetical protein
MAFCTACGAPVAGAFCNQCGTPAAAAASPMTPPPPPTAPVPPPAASGRRRTSPWVWVLVVVGCLVGVGLIAVVGGTMFFVHKAREAGVDTELLRQNPSAAVGKMITALNDDVELIRTDPSAGTVTIRDRHSGKEMTMSFADAQRGNFRLRATDEQGKAATLEFGGDAKAPSWVPTYPGATDAKPVFAAVGTSGDSSGEAGSIAFSTNDSRDQVLSFYRDKAEELGMKVETKSQSTISGQDEVGQRHLNVMTEGSSPTKVVVTYAHKR